MFGGGFDLALIESPRPGYAVIRASGKGAEALFANESGGHRWQRPSGPKKKVHSSTVTVAVLPEPKATVINISPNDIEIRTAMGSGPGGQHRNVTASCVTILHKPTGIMVTCQSDRDQRRNRASALGALRARLFALEKDAQQKSRADVRKNQVGCGERGDKRRTVSMKNAKVIDHITGKKTDVKSYLRGHIEKLS